MPSHKKVALKSIKTLTFQQGEKTAFRRTSAIPQLTCVGKPCQYFEPEVVQCTNMGDDGLGNVQWRCDTDLPSNLRLGKIDVSCEGWAAAGDKHVLQGSCGLTYNLHQTNSQFSQSGFPNKGPWERVVNSIFIIVFYGVLLTLLYSFIRSLLLRFYPSWAPPAAGSFFPWDGHDHHHHGGGPGGGGGGGGGPGFGGGGAGGPPPPYSKHQTFDQPAQPATHAGSTGPGFWTGLAAGGAAAYFAANRANGNRGARERYGRMQRFDDDDRGVGSSNLGEMRRATGFGGSSTR